MITGDVGISGKRMADQDGVGVIRVELPISLISQRETRENLPAAQMQRLIKMGVLARSTMPIESPRWKVSSSDSVVVSLSVRSGICSIFALLP